jgi:hypothetical protein
LYDLFAVVAAFNGAVLKFSPFMNEMMRKFFSEYLVGLFDHLTEEVEGSREHEKLIVLFVVKFRLAIFLLVVVVLPQD